jgi:hypothetical protein
VLSQVGFEPLGEFTPGQKNAPPTAPAFEADIRAKAGDGPFVGTAWMLFAEAEMVVEAQVR